MNYSDLGENTLGAILGRRRPPTAPTAPGRSLRQARAKGASLGTSYLGVGAAVMAGLQMLYGLTLLAWNWNLYPDTLPITLAWLLLLAGLSAVAIVIALRGESMPDWLFLTVIVVITSVVALDFIAIWPLHDIAGMATASACAGCGLMVSVTLRRGREIVTATSMIGLVFIAAIILNSPITTDTLPGQLGVVALTVLPPYLAVYIVKRFRRMMQTELDRVLVQSTVSAPRLAVGMLASEELARLDLAAEELLDSVATGTTALPLDPKTASLAASLATELRLHLIEGRRATWLYHAITESETLGKSVALRDSGSLAGLLDARQRDGLLAAVWLLVSEPGKKPVTVSLTLGPIAAQGGTAIGKKLSVPIVLTTTGIPRNRVDPAVWDAFNKVGHFVDSTHDSSLRVDIECLVDNPADH